MNKKLIFIVGKPRSGTTWLLSILEAHYQCTKITAKMLGITVDRPTNETGLFVREYTDEQIIKKMSSLNDKTVYVEKTPSHLLVLDKISKLFPKACVILIRRNYLDVIFSMIQKNEWWKDSPKSIYEAVILFNKFDKAEEKFKDYYSMVVEYEDLWEDPTKEVKKLLKQLKLDNSASIVNDTIRKTKLGKNLSVALKTAFGSKESIPGRGREAFSRSNIECIRNGIGKE